MLFRCEYSPATPLFAGGIRGNSAPSFADRDLYQDSEYNERLWLRALTSA